MASCSVTSGDRSSPPKPGPADQDSIVPGLDRVRQFVDPLLATALAPSTDAPQRLADAMRYAVLAPGKRLRPALALWAARACGAVDRDTESLWQAAAPAAVAVELIHAYSLVHDDLPAMDDDDLRRGRPTCHRAFDEATAILCGDALQALAFETLARGMPEAVAARGCLVLASAAGAEALVGGQADDLAVERGWAADVVAAARDERVTWMERIHRRKTGRLFLAALELGGLCAAADEARLTMLAEYGRAFGLAFQIADDLLDAEGTEAAVGKRVGKDAGRGKLTFPTVVGTEAARHRATSLAEQAVAAVAPLGAAAADLARLARWIVTRDH
ncbi:MAG: polyprenyl synthetase family protein [Planctomycetota bacterium]|jgi:geranylgeranyl diphosphate synthase type II|nr:MAG: polyprenyl synthetase family protein [Planctomycetota bacterium]